MGLSREEQLRRKREAEKVRRKRIWKDPKLLAELNEKRRKRYAENEAKRKKKKESKKAIEKRRKKWRKDKARQKKKKMLPLSNEVNPASSKLSTRSRSKSMAAIAKKRAETKRVKHYYLLKKLETRVESLKRRVHRYEMRYYRIRHKFLKKSDSPRSVLARDLKPASEKISPQVKRKLLFSAAVSSDFHDSCQDTTPTRREKRIFAERIIFKYVKKYRFLSAAKPYFKYPRKRSDTYRSNGRKHIQIVKKLVYEFFEDDAVSTMSPNKCDTITRNKMKKQKRFLRNSLKYLFIEFCEKNSFVISYPLFCRLRPFWVVNQKLSARDTCLCVKHENAKLICQKLRQLHIVNHADVDILIKMEMCCYSERRSAREDCLLRKCPSCQDQSIVFHEFDGSQESYYESWRAVNEEGRDGKLRRKTAKTRIHCSAHEMVTEFSDVMLLPYMKHLAFIAHQYKAMKWLKDSVSKDPNSVLLHVDFSENFQCKYFNEIQSIHFGGNRMQISLHTGVLYSQENPMSFCTISPDLSHDPVAILKHLEPILLQHKNVENLHFQSDSPSSQYRNKFMFRVIIKSIIPMFPNLKKLTWNFSESAHGKGAPDGVGATVKRTCDRVVSYGVQDVANFDQFTDLVQKEINGVQIHVVDARDKNLRKSVTKEAIAVKGTTFYLEVLLSCLP